jgi:hypothetical protein
MRGTWPIRRALPSERHLITQRRLSDVIIAGARVFS